MDNLGAFFVSTNILDGIDRVKYLFRDELAIPIANGWQILGENDGEFELVTIHTLMEVFPQIMDYVHLENGTRLQVFYENDEFYKCEEIKE